MGKNVTVAHAEVAQATASAEPDLEALEREARRVLRQARQAEQVDKLTAKAERQRVQLEDTERALAEAIADMEGD